MWRLEQHVEPQPPFMGPATVDSRMVDRLIQTAAPATGVAPILVVDDEVAIGAMIRAGLEPVGYVVETVTGVSAARDFLRTRPCSMVLCDYQMEDATGLDLLAYVNRVHPHLPFILLTGYDDIPLARTAIAAGALDFLTKPFEIRNLVRLVEQNWARFERDTQREAHLTHEVLTGTIRALVAAVDAKDPHTATHSERVTELAMLLGEAMALPEQRMEVLGFAALLHDVGKIAVPESILLKNGPLDEAEWAICRRHPERSAEIVAKVGALGEVATIVRHHHERIDGAGYPDRLAGEAIPYFARLITVADCYEAMTADRAYRRALRPSEARDIIAAGLGTHFDRQLGEMFLSLESLP